MRGKRSDRSRRTIFAHERPCRFDTDRVHWSFFRVNGSFMSPWALLLLTSIVLFLPRLLLRQAKSERCTQAQPEVHGLLRVMEVLNTFYCRFWHRLSTDRWAPLPEVGPAILISNHTCGIDHMLLQAATHRLLGFMIAREYYEWSVDSLDLPIHRLHPGQSRRPGFIGHPSGSAGLEGGPRPADLPRRSYRTLHRAGGSMS